jgi:hypothetical protein
VSDNFESRGECCGLKEAAFVCGHVANNHLPILQAIRTQRDFDEDSGWQFLCGCNPEEDCTSPEIWAVGEVIDLEPSLSDWIESPIKTELRRAVHNEPWQLISDGSETESEN